MSFRDKVLRLIEGEDIDPREQLLLALKVADIIVEELQDAAARNGDGQLSDYVIDAIDNVVDRLIEIID